MFRTPTKKLAKPGGHGEPSLFEELYSTNCTKPSTSTQFRQKCKHLAYLTGDGLHSVRVVRLLTSSAELLKVNLGCERECVKQRLRARCLRASLSWGCLPCWCPAHTTHRRSPIGCCSPCSGSSRISAPGTEQKDTRVLTSMISKCYPSFWKLRRIYFILNKWQRRSNGGGKQGQVRVRKE